MSEFIPFGKIGRLSREVVITEKIDGTNAQIFIGDDGTFLTGSRTRWITPFNDNYGFSAWAHDNKEELMLLGPGRHFGEWWGSKIQRAYDLRERRFSLFNTSKWSDDSIRPKCCGVVPVLYKGNFDTAIVKERIDHLKQYGSIAAPGFARPEGVVVWHSALNTYAKKLCENDELPKALIKENS